MQDVEERDRILVDLLLDINNRHDGWYKFLDVLVDHFDLSCCNLYLINTKSQSSRFQEWSGRRPSDIQLFDYFQNYFHTDSTHQLMLSLPIGTWLTPNLRSDRLELESTDAYQKWAIPNDFTYSTGATLLKTENEICAIHFNRSSEKPEFTQDEENRFTAIGQYIRKAIDVRLKLATGDRHSNQLVGALNTFRLPVCVLNEFGELIATNDEFVAVSQSTGDIALSANNKIEHSDKNKDFHLQSMMANTVSIVKGRPASFEADTVSIKDGNQSYQIGFIPLAQRSDCGDGLFVGAMLYLSSLDSIKTICKDQLKKIFGLTESEAQVCQWFAQNKSPKEIAGIEGKSVNTVREQLQSCYKKTNTVNQLELISLIGNLPSA